MVTSSLLFPALSGMLLVVDALQSSGIYVNLSSTVSNSSRSTVCPGETVFYYCVTNGNSLQWNLPTASGSDGLVSYFRGDNPAENYIFKGPITVWLDNSEVVLESYVRLPYSHLLDKSEIVCGGQLVDRHELPYNLADVPPKPDNISYNFLDNSHIKVEWRSVDVAKYFLVSILNQNGSTQNKFLVNDTSVLIEYYEEATVHVKISAMNECHMKSSESYILIQRGRLEILEVSFKLILSGIVAQEIIAIIFTTVISICIVRYYYHKKYSKQDIILYSKK